MRRNRSLARLLEKMMGANRLHDSSLYKLYLNVRYPAHAKARRAEKEFYRSALKHGGARLVFDVGANDGNKTALFLTFADKVVSIEPSPAAVTILKRRFSDDPHVLIVSKGVASKEGTARLHIFDDADCYNTFSPKWVEELARASYESARPKKVAKYTLDIPVITLDRLIEEHGLPSYIKLDVEGSELQAIMGLSRSVELISFECNLPEFQQETLEIISILSARDSSTKYNFVITEPPKEFESDSWLTKEEIARVVKSHNRNFMEIFCRVKG